MATEEVKLVMKGKGTAATTVTVIFDVTTVPTEFVTVKV